MSALIPKFGGDGGSKQHSLAVFSFQWLSSALVRARGAARRRAKKRPGGSPLRARVWRLAIPYFRTANCRTIIGARRFHFRVRDGSGWFTPAMVTKQFGLKNGPKAITAPLSLPRFLLRAGLSASAVQLFVRAGGRLWPPARFRLGPFASRCPMETCTKEAGGILSPAFVPFSSRKRGDTRPVGSLRFSMSRFPLSVFCPLSPVFRQAHWAL